MNQEPVQQQANLPPVEASLEKLVHLALPVRLTHMANGGRRVLEMSCTYDIHPRGARLLSVHDVRVGDRIAVERGRNRSMCQVTWTGDPHSALRGQFVVECIDGNKSPWEDELKQMQEQYLPILAGDLTYRPSMRANRKGQENRRRSPRFTVGGDADLAQIGGESRIVGRLNDLSEHGCQVSAGGVIEPGTNLRIVLNLYDVTVALKGDVKHTTGNLSMGIEFQAIRQGDRPLLDYLLNDLKKRRPDDFADLEVVTDSLPAIAG
ncbi:MAG: PilZ domain-containing protein [Candidatus Sulfotelmatobacter sp.]